MVVALAFCGPLLVGFDPDLPDYAHQLTAPDGVHWLGTDQAGRDQLARTIAGTRTTLQAVVIVFVLTTALGLIVGAVAGYVGGIIDAVAGRVIDVMLGLPSQIIALAVVGALGVGAANLTLAIVVSGWAYPARVARATVLGAHHRLDVTAARMAGIRPLRILYTHVLPGTLATVAVTATTTVGETVLVLAGLSFLGLGAQPPTAELGQMLADSQTALVSSPWLMIGPSAVIAATVAAAMLLADALRDALDPATPTRRRRVPRPRPAAEASAGSVPAASAPRGAVHVTDLHVTYPDGTHAVRGVTLHIGPGECLAVVGESGCGKTTLARAVLRLLPTATHTDGTIHVGDADILTLPNRSLHRVRGRVVGYVAQDPYAACDPDARRRPPRH
jgi:ABC-type dipeptide/oligopeptide/nickel transport system permease subunit